MKLNATHFAFLDSAEDSRTSSNKGGSRVKTLSYDEARRFVSIMTPVIKCMPWKSKEQQKIVQKVTQLIERAAENAYCEDCNNELPFHL